MTPPVTPMALAAFLAFFGLICLSLSAHFGERLVIVGLLSLLLSVLPVAREVNLDRIATEARLRQYNINARDELCRMKASQRKKFLTWRERLVKSGDETRALMHLHEERLADLRETSAALSLLRNFGPKDCKACYHGNRMMHSDLRRESAFEANNKLLREAAEITRLRVERQASQIQSLTAEVKHLRGSEAELEQDAAAGWAKYEEWKHKYHRLVRYFPRGDKEAVGTVKASAGAGTQTDAPSLGFSNISAVDSPPLAAQAQVNQPSISAAQSAYQNKTIEAQAQTILKLRGELTGKDDRIAQLEEALGQKSADADARIQALEEALGQKSRQIADLEEKSRQNHAGWCNAHSAHKAAKSAADALTQQLAALSTVESNLRARLVRFRRDVFRLVKKTNVADPPNDDDLLACLPIATSSLAAPESAPASDIYEKMVADFLSRKKCIDSIAEGTGERLISPDVLPSLSRGEGADVKPEVKTRATELLGELRRSAVGSSKAALAKTLVDDFAASAAPRRGKFDSKRAPSAKVSKYADSMELLAGPLGEKIAKNCKNLVAYSGNEVEWALEEVRKELKG